MKKLVIVMLVLGMVSAANAALTWADVNGDAVKNIINMNPPSIMRFIPS